MPHPDNKLNQTMCSMLDRFYPPTHFGTSLLMKNFQNALTFPAYCAPSVKRPQIVLILHNQLVMLKAKKR